MWDMTLASSSHLLFFSRSHQPQLLDLLSAASEEGFANQESMMVTYVQPSVVAAS